MSGTNDFLVFCPTDTGSNLESQANYAIDADRTIGNQPGIASSKFVNKALRQACYVASQLAQYMTNVTGLDVLDDQNTTNFQAALTAALGVPNSPLTATNLGLAASVATNALTISLKDASGNTPSASSPVRISFRNSSDSVGQYSLVPVTAATTIVVPSSATLGMTSTIAGYVWVYAVYDGSSVSLGVCGGNVVGDERVRSTTTISSSATADNVIYTTSGVTSKAVRIIGRLNITEATAGTWASAPTSIELLPSLRYNTSQWVSGISNVTCNAGAGTNPTKPTTMQSDQVLTRREGVMMHGRINMYANSTSGSTSGTGAYTWLIPNSNTINTTNLTSYNTFTTGATNQQQAASANLQGGGWMVSAARGGIVPMLWDSTHIAYATNNSTSVEMLSSAGDTAYNASSTWGVGASFEVPILGWYDYGP